MTVFGFIGSFDAAVVRATVIRHAGGAERAAGLPSLLADNQASAWCWGGDSASDGRIAVTLAGGPAWRGTPQGPGTPSETAATLLSAYKATGVSAVENLTGRFALAIVDLAARRAILTIDPMGIGRLCYRICDEGLVFSSSAEIAARQFGGSPTLRPQAIFDYLVHHVVPSEETIFDGVRKLPAGSYVLYENRRAIVKRAWAPAFVEGGRPDFETLKDGLHNALRTAVASCVPDQHTGAFLSGGLDSSTVAAVLSEVGPRPAKTFTIGFGYADYDELQFSRIANARFGCLGHEYVIHGSDIAETFSRISEAFDEPFGNSSALPAYYCAKLARDAGIDHLLAGDGGDELFSGNSRYAEQQIFEWYRLLPRSLQTHLLEPLINNWPRGLSFWLTKKGRGYIEKANTPLPRRFESRNPLFENGPGEILHPDFLAAVDPMAPLRRMQEVWDAAPTGSALQKMLYYDWQYTLADNDLRKVETMAAMAGVRVSYPMLHPSVVELSTKVPPSMMMPRTRLRDFYKRAMDGYLPTEIIHKKKHGFGLPFGLWLKESLQLREMITGNLSRFRARQIVRTDFIDNLIRLHEQDDARHYGVYLWVLAMLEQWISDHRVST